MAREVETGCIFEGGDCLQYFRLRRVIDSTGAINRGTAIVFEEIRYFKT